MNKGATSFKKKKITKKNTTKLQKQKVLTENALLKLKELTKLTREKRILAQHAVEEFQAANKELTTLLFNLSGIDGWFDEAFTYIDSAIRDYESTEEDSSVFRVEKN